ncbi:sugar ABC transporter substrate-binding protein [Microbacterium sp.]|uniref:sugar ABC transporter substrate-binding protein n=1 Tax=Microbacterium sp. TaxID=51671 RepID=UPI002E3229E2|nr:extracellular solute-binding protein [Microbacterium sp.]HEX5729775.1 extracellular solute-binding protein [Microbacterium sp.]
MLRSVAFSESSDLRQLNSRGEAMRKIARVAVVLAGVSLLVTGCGSSGGGESTAEPAPDATEEAVRGDEDLVIWAEPTRIDYIQPLADAFAEENGITVGVQGIVDPRQAFITANSAGNGPDVIAGAHDWLGQLVQNGSIDPLQLSASDLDAYSPVSVRAGTYDGQLYMLPYAVESVALYCNTDYAPDTYATIEDVIAAGEPGVAAGELEVPLILQQGEPGDAYHMQPLFTSGGGYIFGVDAEGNYNAEDLGLNKPEAIAAAQKIAGLGSAGVNTIRTSISSDNYLSLFTEGKAACMVSGPWALADVQTALGDKYSIQPVPGFAGATTAQPFMGAQGFMVASEGKNKAFAQEFVTNYLNTEEAMQELYDLSGQPPAMTAVIDGVTDEDVLAFATAVDNAAPMPAMPEMAEVFAPLGLAWSAIISGEDPAATMETTYNTISAAISG